MNETVDSVYRFVTDQSSSAYNKMNSFVASLRRRFDKVLTATNSNSTSTNSSTNDGEISMLKEIITDAHLMLAMINNEKNVCMLLKIHSNNHARLLLHVA